MIRKCAVVSPGNLAGKTAGTYICSCRTVLLFFHSSLNLVNDLRLSRLYLLRRRGVCVCIDYRASNLSSGLRHQPLVAVLVKNPYLQYQVGCRGIVPSAAASYAFVDESVQGRNLSDDHRAHHQRRIPQSKSSI